MRVQFGNESLAQCFREEALAVARWGRDVGTQYVFVLTFLTCIDQVADLARFAFLDASVQPKPEGTHWTVRLTDTWRLRLEVAERGRALFIAEVIPSD